MGESVKQMSEQVFTKSKNTIYYNSYFFLWFQTLLLKEERKTVNVYQLKTF